MKTHKRRLIVPLLLLAAACAGIGRSLPRAEDLAVATGEDVDALRRGRVSYVRECTACHRHYWPEEYSPAAWGTIAPDMGERAGLAPGDIDDLTRFLQAASRESRRIATPKTN